jgi:RNA polymerase sigma-70 factor, ECF subfamily
MATLRSLVRPGRALTSTVLDAAAFDALYRAEAPAVWNYIRYRIGPGEADDLTADVFARAWAARASFAPDRGTLEAWLWAIARHAVIDRLRDRRPIAVALPDALPGGDASADAARKQEVAAALTAVDGLAPADREIIALRFGAGRTNRDIAALLGLSEANVAQRLRRALRSIRMTMDAAEGDDRV